VKIDNRPIEAKQDDPNRSTFRAFLEKEWLRVLLLAAIGFVVRVPALQGQLIWDDQYLARDNPFIKSPWLVLEAFRHYLFLDSFSAHYRPVQNLSLMLDYAFWNANIFGFHLTNVLLHVLSGTLLYFLLRRLVGGLRQTTAKFDNSVFAFLIAAIWIVHPVHSAAVDYISGRADSLSFTFACGGWLLFLYAREYQNRWARISLDGCALLFALLALCSRESACIWISLFTLHLLFFEKRFSRQAKGAAVIGCITVLALYAGLRQLPEQRLNPAPSMGWSQPVRAMLIFRALGDYGRLLVFPSNLHMERTVFSSAAFQSAKARADFLGFEYLSILGLGVLVLLGGLAMRRSPAQRLRVFGAMWFAVAFLPISNVVDLNATVAEHWLYLPSVGFFIFLAGCVLDLPLRFRQITVAFALILVGAFGIRSFNRSSDWVNAETFYERTAAAGGTSCRVSVNLGLIYTGRGQYEKAERLFREVLKIQPDYTIARNNLAGVLGHLGKEQDAERVLADATRGAHESKKDYPRTWIAAMNFAHMLDTHGDATGALNVLKKACDDYPQTWELISCESELLRRDNKLDEALALIRPYAQKNWWHYGAWVAMGRLHAEKGDVDLADAALRHASWLDVRSTDPLNLIALMRVRQNRLEEACRTQRRAVARQPDQPRQYLLLSNILDKMGRGEDARAALAQVSRLRTLADSQVVGN
jgi:Flp pilus assembly protein TadD